MATHTFKSAMEMQAWGKAFSKKLKVGDIVALVGELGAGKTTLVQSIARAWGYKHGASSPTFALANEYVTPRGLIYHMDMYRLSPKELKTFPLEDYWGSGLCIIEWADRIEDRLPKNVQTIRMEIASPTTRRVHLDMKRKRRGR